MPDTGLHNRFTAVLFDLDGTLVDTNIDFKAMKAALLKLCGEHGALQEDVAALNMLEAVEHTAAALPESEAQAFREQAWALLEEIEMRYVPSASPYPHAAELLHQLGRLGVRTAVVTRNCSNAVNSLMRLLPPVDAVLAREDVNRAKPDPGHLLDALQQLGTQPAEALMVGDHRMDIQAGRAAGTRTAGLLHGRSSNCFNGTSPDYVFSDLKELADALFSPHR